jgi:hypothetical protein
VFAEKLRPSGQRRVRAARYDDWQITMLRSRTKHFDEREAGCVAVHEEADHEQAGVHRCNEIGRVRRNGRRDELDAETSIGKDALDHTQELDIVVKDNDGPVVG